MLSISGFRGNSPFTQGGRERGAEESNLPNTSLEALTHNLTLPLSRACKDMEAQRFRPTSLESESEMRFLEGSGDAG